MPKGKKKTPLKKRPERNSKGQFVKGNCGGPGGNPYAGYIQKLRDALYSAVTEEDIREIAIAQIRRAKNNTEAAKFVFDYVLGKPAQQINLGGEGGGPIEIYVVPPNANNRRKPKQK